MNSVAQSIIQGMRVTSDDVKYLLWVTLCKLQEQGIDSVDDIDGDESYAIDEMLDQLDLDLGLLPGGGQ